MTLDRKDNNERLLAEKIEALLIKPDEHSPLLLQSNHDKNRYFVTFLRDGTHPLANCRRLVSGISQWFPKH
jgi:hypothetical protein